MTDLKVIEFRKPDDEPPDQSMKEAALELLHEIEEGRADGFMAVVSRPDWTCYPVIAYPDIATGFMLKWHLVEMLIGLAMGAEDE